MEQHYNKFSRWYNQLCEARKISQSASITESHHIVPRFAGGLNEPANLVRLTPREHFIAHRLLARFVILPAHIRAANCSIVIFSGKRHQKQLCSRQIEIARAASQKNLQVQCLSPAGQVFDSTLRELCLNTGLSYFTTNSKLRTCDNLVITAGKFKGWFISVNGLQEASSIIESRLKIATLNRQAGTRRQWQEAPKKSTRGSTVSLKDPSGAIQTFTSLREAEALTGNPWTSIQSCKGSLPYTFKFGAWKDWTLLFIGD